MDKFLKSRSTRQSFYYYNCLLIIFCISLLGLQRFEKPKLLPPSAYIPPPLAVQHLTAGLKIQLATSLWVRAMGDLDYCEQLINDRDCVGKSWLFHIFNLATELDPIFEPVFYQVAGLSLTIIISDYIGASIIFDKGVKQHPDYWRLTYAAAYHAHFEEKNLLKAGRLYSLAGKHGAPEWIGTLAGRLAAEGGDLELADQILRTMASMNIEQKYIDRLMNKIKEAKAKAQ